MSVNNKIIWSEGMFLRPQHFQQQDRYIENYIEGRTGLLSAYNWGFSDIQIDGEALSQGKVSIASMRGVLPDGTPFNAPDMDPLPDIIDIPENTSNELVYLCLPLKRPGTQESIREDEESSRARFLAYNFDIHNNTTESGETSRIQVGRLKTCLKLGSQDLSGYSTLAITRVIEAPAEKPLKIDRQFIPAMTNCLASSVFVAFFEELKGLLKQRGEALGHRLADSGRSGSAEIADYMLLQLINRVEPLIQHLSTLNVLHPVHFYNELVQIAGELSTFTQSSKRPPALPMYSHKDLQHTFGGIYTVLRQALSMVLEQSAISLQLVERKFGIHVAPITDRSLMTSGVFVMAVKADMPTEVLRTRFPTQAKIAPVETIRELISTQLPGLALRPLPVAPRQIPYHAGYTYFEIQQGTELWGAMTRSGGFAVHLGAEFPGLSMELWAIRS
ncbi:type VI secretion system baseplate subunit TssK [Marinibactrum halimedae]|uniref:Type VI secretion system-associated protein n=1 Tax=Marinibactrum halimedae TaxID=1444977 RepID=A0AA37T8Q8_9GAMM|nr:type VI secretion system baseplate subunit TssK [Marinibactrum halimedae]MCD9458354.1 type VI secretion system baseplate subunit TssK [Marinibactrum halimedae]GLS26051.1 type VI secretion system-associated protein [Marinibactrum halimedae]